MTEAHAKDSNTDKHAVSVESKYSQSTSVSYHRVLFNHLSLSLSLSHFPLAISFTDVKFFFCMALV